MAGGNFNKNRNLTYLGGWSPVTARVVFSGLVKILTVYTETLNGLNHIFSPDGLKPPFSLQATSSKWLWLGEQWAEGTFPGQGRG